MRSDWAARLGRLPAGATSNVLRAFRPIIKKAGLDPAAWTPRELRHSFVSLLSSNGVSIEDIADLCGHSGTTITESVYRHQLRPVLLVKGQDEVLSDGLWFSSWADSRFPCWWSSDLRVRG